LLGRELAKMNLFTKRFLKTGPTQPVLPEYNREPVLSGQQKQ